VGAAAGGLPVDPDPVKSAAAAFALSQFKEGFAGQNRKAARVANDASAVIRAHP
jgi:hypothetical protein